MRPSLFILIIALFLAACSPTPSHVVTTDERPSLIPDYVGVTIPASVAPLNFGVSGDGVEAVDVVVRGSKGGELHVSGHEACFDLEEWHALTEENVGDSLMVTVTVLCDGSWKQYREFPIYVSADPLGEWGLTYRLIPPGYETYGAMGLYQRDLSNFEQTSIIENKDIGMGCVNCHTPDRTDPQRFTFHVRGDHGATVVGHGGRVDVLEARNEQLGGGMVYPYWHPTSRFVAYSTNQTHQLFHQVSDRRVEVYDEASDIIVLDVESHELLRDSRLATDHYLENYPAFSPDGRWLYFCRAERVDSVWRDYNRIRYDICRIAFNPETLAFEGEVEMVVNAHAINKSANMPRLSYDGRYLLYTLCDYGCFPIWHSEADLWMKDLERGEERPLDAANSTAAESFHNWSVNSRWIVFTSRRDTGVYTQLYIAHVASDGTVSKPFRLPQRHPQEYDVETIYSFNTPDFAAHPMTVERKRLSESILSTGRQSTQLRSVDN